jgi:hypothetical protein
MPGQYFDVYGMIEVDEPPQLETVRSEFFRLVGESIKEWAKVEEQLFELVHFAMQCPRKQAAIVFYRTQTIGRRFELADQLLRACLSADDIARWKCATKNIDPLKAVRNLLAHAPMRHHHKLSVGAQRVAVARLVLGLRSQSARMKNWSERRS